MSSRLKKLEPFTFNNEEFDSTVPKEEIEDVEKLKNLKEVSQNFLRVNNFDLSKEPDFSEFSEDQFVEYILEKSKNSIITNKLNELKVEINLRSLMSNYYTHKEDKKNKIFIFFLPEGNSSSNSLSISDYSRFISLVLKLDCQEGVLISKKDLSSKAREAVNKSNIDIGSCEGIFKIIAYKDDDFIDITKHSFVPEVTKIYREGEEVDKFMKENNVEIKSLPRIMLSDPLAKFYRAKIGDVFQLKRKIIISKSLLEEEIVFKLIIPPPLKK